VRSQLLATSLDWPGLIRDIPAIHRPGASQNVSSGCRIQALRAPASSQTTRGRPRKARSTQPVPPAPCPPVLSQWRACYPAVPAGPWARHG